MNTGIYFADIFEVDPAVLKEYGALNISLVNDLPLFVDPFLLFHSVDAVHRALHEDILRYLAFLRDRATEGAVGDGLLRAWYMFPEVKQNWLGYSKTGNSGAGLGIDFARSLHRNLNMIFSDFGAEKFARSSHLEKLCLIEEGVGCDRISDFVTNLIKGHLLNYTQIFAKAHLAPSHCREMGVRHVRFDYSSRTWVAEKYLLPYYNDDFVVLTPLSILTRDDTWINRSDLRHSFAEIVETIPNDQLRAELNQFLARQLPKVPQKFDIARARELAIKKYPEIIDYFIRLKEDTGDEAHNSSVEKVDQTEQFFVEQVSQFAIDLYNTTSFYRSLPATIMEARERVFVLKSFIENDGGYRFLFFGGKPIQREQDLHLLYRLVWFAFPSGVTPEQVASLGMKMRNTTSKNLVVFRLAGSTAIRRNLEKVAAVVMGPSGDPTEITVVISYSDSEYEKVIGIMRGFRLQNNSGIVLINVNLARSVGGMERDVDDDITMDGKALERFRDAIIDAFHTWDRLAQLVKFGLDEDLESIVGRSDLNTGVFELFRWAESQGKLSFLLTSAIKQNPSNPKLASFAREFQNGKKRQVANSGQLRGDHMLKILFLGANPTGTTQLALTQEVQAIKDHLRSSEHGKEFHVEQEWAVKLSDLNAALLRHRPDIVHFSGHGSNAGELVVETESGAPTSVNPEALTNLFKILKRNIRCVVLNACFSAPQADAIAEHIDCVVGMTTAVGDKGAVTFAWAFYEALGFNVSVQEAFDLGRNQVDFSRLPDKDTPKLVCRGGVRPAEIYLLDPR